MRFCRCGAPANKNYLCDECANSHPTTTLSDDEMDGYLGSPKAVPTSQKLPEKNGDKLPGRNVNPYREVASKIRKEAESSHRLRDWGELAILASLVFAIWYFHLFDALIPQQFRGINRPPTKMAATQEVQPASAQPVFRTNNLRQMYAAGDFENVIKESSKNVLHTGETVALVFESRVQLAKREPAALAYIRSEILAKAREHSSDYLQRALGWTMLFDSDPGSFRNGFSMLNSLAHDGNDPLVHAYLGFAYQKLGKMPEARASWKKALQLDHSIAWLPISKKQKSQAPQSVAGSKPSEPKN
jgi:hypothetical protein